MLVAACVEHCVADSISLQSASLPELAFLGLFLVIILQTLASPFTRQLWLGSGTAGPVIHNNFPSSGITLDQFLALLELSLMTLLQCLASPSTRQQDLAWQRRSCHSQPVSNVVHHISSLTSMG